MNIDLKTLFEKINSIKPDYALTISYDSEYVTFNFKKGNDQISFYSQYYATIEEYYAKVDEIILQEEIYREEKRY